MFNKKIINGVNLTSGNPFPSKLMKYTLSSLCALALSLGWLADISNVATAAEKNAETNATTYVIKAAVIYVGNGTVIENGSIIIRDGIITAVGDNITIPGGAEVIELDNCTVTPGLIDANAQIEAVDVITPAQGRETNALALMFQNHEHNGPSFACDGTPLCQLASLHENLEPTQVCPVCGQFAVPDKEAFISGLANNTSYTEGYSEVVPHTLVLDSLNFRSPDWDRLVRGGVTTVFASPDSAAVIGPRGAIVHTAGPMRNRIIQEAADVKAAISTDTYSQGGGNMPPYRGFTTTRTRRPNSRMGIAWVFRKAFYDATKYENGQPVSGADMPDEFALQTLTKILKGEIPLRIQAREQIDISTAIRVASEFGLKFTLLEATEAYHCLDEIKAANLPVIFGPIYTEPTGQRRRTDEARESRLSTIKDLYNAGIKTAISAQDLREEDGLARQAMYAMRAGLDFNEALRAVTQIPAQMLNIDDKLGTVENGKQADLIVWNGTPFAATSQPVVVMINGQIIVDKRETK